jgi:hypothetical protein
MGNSLDIIPIFEIFGVVFPDWQVANPKRNLIRGRNCSFYFISFKSSAVIRTV